MDKKIFTILSILIFLLLLSLKTFANSVEKIHPINRIIIKFYPRKEKLWFPSVPRILAIEALSLYKMGQSFFIHIGKEGGNVPGGLQLSEKIAWKINPNKLFLKLRKYRYIILYCD